MGTVREITDSGLPDNVAESLFQDDLGQIWVGTQSGVAVFKSDRFVPVASVPYGIVYSFAEDSAGNVWMSHQEGLFQLFRARVVERIPWAKLGRREPATALLHDAVQGGLWLGFRDGGVAYFKDGQLRASYAGAEGLGEGMVRGFYIDGNGTLWAATDGGLSRIKDGRVLTLTSQNGLPCNTVHWMMEDDAHSVWLYLACGLVRIARSELDAWVSHPKQTIQRDGFRQFRRSEQPSVYGRLWHGCRKIRGWQIVVLAFRRRQRHRSAASCVQQTPAAGPHRADHRRRQTIRPQARDAPARQRPQPPNRLHRPEPGRAGRRSTSSTSWRDRTGTGRKSINERQATYTNLPPRNYRFRVIASNNSGVWNETGDTLEFSIAPAYYQTTWFYASCVAAFLAMLWGLYRLRLYQIRREFNAQLDGRVDERLRVARELHDTLLQSFQASLIQMQAARNMFARRPEKAVQSLDNAITTAAGAVAEGRRRDPELARPAGRRRRSRATAHGGRPGAGALRGGARRIHRSSA